jgi:iron complex outermembrane receptor protein
MVSNDFFLFIRTTFAAIYTKMKKKIVLKALVLLGLVHNAQAQDVKKDTLTMGSVSVQENRLKVDVFAPSYSILNFTKATLMPNKSVADVLALESGLDIRQRGPVGVQADVSIRGGSFDQTLLLWNGLKMSDPQTGHHLMNLPFPAIAIDRIVVSKNPAAKQYGLNAYSGYINVLTKVPEKNTLYFGTRQGDFGLQQYQLGSAFNQKIGKIEWGQHLSSQYSKSNGYTQNTDFETKELFYQSDLKTAKAKLTILGAYSERAFGARGFYVANSTEFETVKTGFLGLIHQLKTGNWDFKSQAYWRNNDDRYIYLRDKPEIYTNQHYTNTSGVEFHSVNKNKKGETGIGLDYRIESIRSYNISTAGTKPQLGKHQRNIFGMFVDHKFDWYKNKLIFIPGVYFNVVDGKADYFPGIDLKYFVNKRRDVIVFASANEAMRLPTYTDFYYVSPNNIGNPNLKPERVKSSELGLQYTFKNHLFGLALFNKRSENTIDWSRPSDTVKWQPLNLTRLNTNGFDFNYKYTSNGLLQLLSVDYTYLDMNVLQTENWFSRYSLSNLKHQLVCKMSLQLPKKFLMTATFRHLQRVQLVDYQLLDLRLNWTNKQITAFVDVSNVLDTKYLEVGFVQMPGRWASAGINIKLESKK